MAFHFAFKANTADDAKKMTFDANAPQQVKDFVLLAIHGIVMTGKPYAHIEVEAAGHLCDSQTSYDVSTVQIEVKPIPF